MIVAGDTRRSSGRRTAVPFGPAGLTRHFSRPPKSAVEFVSWLMEKER
jgi:hypothetical protein